MELVLTNMRKIQTFADILRTIREIKKTQETLVSDIKKEQKAILESIVGP